MRARTSAVGRYQKGLRAAVAAEVKAYGFTLLIWTTATLKEHFSGTPGVGQTLAYLVGALLAMGVVIVAAFGGLHALWQRRGVEQSAFGAIHLVSVAVGVAAGVWAGTHVGGLLGWGLASLVGVLVYQLLLALEVTLSMRSGADADASDGSDSSG